MSQNARTETSEAGMTSLRARQRAERAGLILDAAQELFAERGYHDASIEEIAARAGIAKGTVYLHFAGKEELLAAMFEQQITEFLAWVDQASSERRTVRARLEQIFLYVFTRMQERRNQVLLEQSHRTGLIRSVIEKHEGLNGQIARTMERIAGLLEEGKYSGELDPVAPTPIMLATFVSLISPGGYEPLLSSGEVSPGELVGHVSRIFFPGRGAPAAQEHVPHPD